MTGHPLKVSVVITTHNEARGIGATLAALRRQTMRPEEYEIVLVDDRSTDGTVDVARASGHPSLALHRAVPDPASPLTTRQQALDTAFGLARGRVIATLDGDCRVPPGWLEGMAAPILAGTAEAVAGPVTFGPEAHAVALWQNCDAAQYFAISAALARLGRPGGVLFGNFAFRADLYAATGGFGALGFALTEDLAFGLALRRAGARIAYAPVARAAEVAPCPDPAALVARSDRIATGPFTTLAAVLTAWPLTLLVLVLAAAASGAPALWLLAGLRYLAGMGIVAAALHRYGRRRALAFVPFYEPLVFPLSAAVLIRRLRGRSVGWGGHRYDR